MSRIVPLNGLGTLRTSQDYALVNLDNPCRTLSSAVLNGGFQRTNHILNMRVAKTGSYVETPQDSLQSFGDKLGLRGKIVGMMTAASMNSLRYNSISVDGVDICAIVTLGLNNARRVGDKAEYREIFLPCEEIGTINLILLTTAGMSDAAMVEAITVATEAKAAALSEANITSPISGAVATGTGTDSIVIASALTQPRIDYCGKHMIFGEVVGRITKEIILSSIART